MILIDVEQTIPKESLGPNDVLEDVVAHVCVHRRQGVVQQVHSAVVVHSAGQAYLQSGLEKCKQTFYESQF
jgi:hypothetical protein